MALRFFKYEEFDSPDVHDSGRYMDADFLAMLDNAREIAGIPFKINSGCSAATFLTLASDFFIR